MMPGPCCKDAHRHVSHGKVPWSRPEKRFLAQNDFAAILQRRGLGLCPPVLAWALQGARLRRMHRAGVFSREGVCMSAAGKPLGRRLDTSHLDANEGPGIFTPGRPMAARGRRPGCRGPRQGVHARRLGSRGDTHRQRRPCPPGAAPMSSWAGPLQRPGERIQRPELRPHPPSAVGTLARGTWGCPLSPTGESGQR